MLQGFYVYEIFFLVIQLHTGFLTIYIFLVRMIGPCVSSIVSYYNQHTLQVVTWPIYTNYWQPSAWGMMILYSVHSLSCICYLLLNTDVWHDNLTPECLFLPLVANQNSPVVLVQCLFSSGMSTMLILVQKESRLTQVHKFLCIFFRSFQIHPLVVAYHYARTGHGIELDLVL